MPASSTTDPRPYRVLVAANVLGLFPTAGGQDVGPRLPMIKLVCVAGPSVCTSPCLEGWTSSRTVRRGFPVFLMDAIACWVLACRIHCRPCPQHALASILHFLRFPRAQCSPSRIITHAKLRFLFSLAVKRRLGSIAATPQHNNHIFDPLLDPSTTRHHRLTT